MGTRQPIPALFGMPDETGPAFMQEFVEGRTYRKRAHVRVACPDARVDSFDTERALPDECRPSETDRTGGRHPPGIKVKTTGCSGVQ
jgi:hypothetical protein